MDEEVEERNKAFEWTSYSWGKMQIIRYWSRCHAIVVLYTSKRRMWLLVCWLSAGGLSASPARSRRRRVGRRRGT
ncbi:hypothetical protein BCR44DRAFT_1427590 [Catenaria anguillulae PL171]|uniref:Uncharacterized protein n=1 Tax=Catenaria anguillulae PL171 TaxID=765915 RepID=A0A1Y2HZX5_9FUNG|nr:hypothetical protein BCR44DRAFT_1427590 [Catenaria anguillulae PL171]